MEYIYEVFLSMLDFSDGDGVGWSLSGKREQQIEYRNDMMPVATITGVCVCPPGFQSCSIA